MKIIEIHIVKTKSEKVAGRADIHFEGFLLKGFKIVQDPVKKVEYLTPPSYKSPLGWRALFKTDSLEDWREIERQVLEKFNVTQMEDSTNNI